MLPDIAPALNAHFATMTVYAATGSKHIMEFAGYMETVIDRLPDDLKPTGELLTKICMQVLTESFTESLLRFSELGLQEITRAQQGNQKQECCSGCPSARRSK